MHIDEFFAKHPVFTHEEYCRYMISRGTNNLNTQREVLAYHIKKLHIVRIRRGYYASIPIAFRSTSNAFRVDPYLIAGRINDDAVLAYNTAFDFHGISYSESNRFIFMSNKVIRPFEFQQLTFVCLPFPKILIEKNEENIEVVSQNRSGLRIKITSIERSLVDVLDRPDFSGGWEEIWRSALHIPILNLDIIIKYVVLLNNSTLAAKVGFFLEQNKTHFNVDDESLRVLEKIKPRSIHYLERNKRETGKLIKRWNLVVPHSIINQSWEEPNESF